MSLFTPLLDCWVFDDDLVFDDGFAFAVVFGCGSWVFRGLPGLPLASCFDSGLSWLPDAGSPVGNGGTGSNFVGEPPALCFAFALVSGDRSCLCSVLYSDFLMR